MADVRDAEIAAVRVLFANGAMPEEELHRRVRHMLGYRVDRVTADKAVRGLRRSGAVRTEGLPGHDRLTLGRDGERWSALVTACTSAEADTLAGELDGKALSIRELSCATGIDKERVRVFITHALNAGSVRVLDGHTPHYTLVRRESE